jgi:hypothetical protein
LIIFVIAENPYDLQDAIIPEILVHGKPISYTGKATISYAFPNTCPQSQREECGRKDWT